MKRIDQLPLHPKREDLIPFSTIRLRKKRMLKKFLHMSIWRVPVPHEIWSTFMARVMVEPIYRGLNYPALAKTLLRVEELPLGAFAVYDKPMVVATGEDAAEVIARATLMAQAEGPKIISRETGHVIHPKPPGGWKKGDLMAEVWGVEGPEGLIDKEEARDDKRA
jgi:hypothetical protein